MKWIKRGLIFKPSKKHPFCKTRVMCPTPMVLNDTTIRIYAGFCDEYGISRPGYVDVNANNPSEIYAISSAPLFDLGPDGTFDDHGICPTCIILHDGHLHMAYFGFQLGTTIPFYMFSGLAISYDDGQSFSRLGNAPFLDRTNSEFLTRSGPWIIKDEGQFRIWYPCATGFIKYNGKQTHTYHLATMASNTLSTWNQKSQISLPLNRAHQEFGFGRPYVLKRKRSYLMFYSIRTHNLGYRIGYAESTNGIEWKRKDEQVGISISESGWDSEMICYPSIIELNGNTWLFYNGNNMGKTGFGYAKLHGSLTP